MKQLSRKKIQDMIDLNGANISSRRSSGGSGAGGGGGVSSAWVDEHYVSKDFFARLFTINGTDENDDDVVVEPNDLETTITNIQLMFGSWTEHYLSALGIGSGGGGGGGALLTEPLASINEAGMGTPSGENKVIAWNGSTWTYMPYTTGSGTVTSVTMTVPTGFKVSNGDTQTINNSGTFALTFGGTITKNQVLASPAAANGTPAWRALVADDIPTLTAAKISDITLTDGMLTIGNNSITPLTDATLKNNYTWWGQTMNNNGAVTGNITVGNGYILLNNDKGIFSYNAPAEGETAATIELMKLRSNNSARLFYGTAAAGYSTLIYGDAIALRYGADGTNGLIITSSGLVTIGTGSTSSFVTEKLNVNGNIRTATANGSYIQIGAVRLVYDSTNTAIKVEKSDGTAAGLYATGFLSALGAGSGGGGGSTTLTEPLASINEAGMGSPSATNKVIVYTSSGWSYMPYTTGGSGSVASVGLSMPTGFTVTGTPVTSSGTLAVTFGGSVAKNKVLAAPSSAAGTPDWRTLVAADIPDLSGSYLPLTGGMLSIAADGFKVRRNSTGTNSFSSVTFYKGTSNDNQTMLGRLGFKAVDTPVFRDVNGNYYTLYHEGNLSTSGTAFAATKLTTVSKTAWGQTYWTSDGVPTNVSGTITVGNGDIVMNNNKYIYFIDNPSEGSPAQREVLRFSSSNNLLIGYGTATAGYTTHIYGNSIGFRYGTSGTQGMVLRSTGHLTINASDDTDATRNIYLNVGGNVKATKFYFTNRVYLEYDSSNSGVHLVGAGLYADTYLSSLGAGSGGGSGSGISMNDVWTAMAMSAPNTSSQQIHVSHLAQALGSYATKKWVNDNAVTIATQQTITAAKTMAANLTMAGNITPMTDNYYSLGTEQKRFSALYVYGLVYVGGMTIQYQTGSGVLAGYHLSAGNSDIVLETSGNVWQRTTSQYYSDMRLKDVISDVDLSVEQIADAPVFNFKWKDADGDMQIGSSAQYWHKHLKPVTAIASNGQYGMDYGRAALISSVIVARKVMTHEERIAALESENKELKKKLETLKAS